MASIFWPVLVVLYLGLFAPSSGAEIFVQVGSVGGNGQAATPYGTIQEAVNAAGSGDTITVLQGTYATAVTIASKSNILLRSASGNYLTKMQAVSNLFTITSSTGIVVDGFSFIGNYHAVKVTGGQVTLLNCAWSSNVNPLELFSGASVTVVNSSFDNNGPHAIESQSSSVVIESTRFRLNSGGASGGAIYTYASSVSVNASLFIENYGGIAVDFPLIPSLLSTVTITNSKFSNNNGGTGAGTLSCSGTYNLSTSGNYFCGAGIVATCTGFTESTLISPSDACGVCFGEGGDMDCNYQCFTAGPVTCSYTPKNIYVSTLNGSDLNDGLTLFTPKSTLQAAVNISQDHDTVIVLPGIYSGAGNTYVSLLGKNITIRSQSGLAEDVTVNCTASESAFLAISGETAQTVIQGITIQNCVAAINVTLSTLKVKDVVLRNNRNSAITVMAGYLILDGSTVNNTMWTSDPAAGAITLLKVRTTVPGFKIMRSRFVGNVGKSGGAITFISKTSGMIVDSVFSNNAASQSGGAIYITSASKLVMTGTSFWGNQASSLGGALFCEISTSPPIVTTSNVKSCGLLNSVQNCNGLLSLPLFMSVDGCGVCDGSTTPDCSGRCWGGKTVISGTCCTQGLLDFLPGFC